MPTTQYMPDWLRREILARFSQTPQQIAEEEERRRREAEEQEAQLFGWHARCGQDRIEAQGDT